MKTTNVKFHRLYELGTEKVAEIDNLLLHGRSAPEVAKVIHEDWNKLTDIKRDNLARQLRRYRKEMDVSIAARQQVARRDGKSLLRVSEQIEKIDVIEDLNSLIHSQKMRINRLLEHESSLPVEKGLVSDVKYEMQQLIAMYKLIANLQLETGIMRRAPKTVSGMFSYDDETGRFEFESKIENHKELNSATTSIMEVLEGEFEELDEREADVT